MIKQRTIKNTIEVLGIGTHSGQNIKLRLQPAPVNSGIVFHRSDLPGSEPISVTPLNIGDTSFASTLAHGQVKVATIEHLMATLSGLGIDNLYIELDGPEVPIMDGSAISFVMLIQAAGIEEQDESKKFLRIKCPIEVQHGASWVRLLPFNGCKLSFTLEYNHPVIGAMPKEATFNFATNSFIRDLSRARTFGLLSDYEKLRAMNLAKGTNLSNVVVVDDTKVLNPEGLRYANECARHKLLDALGDLYQLGFSFIGEFKAYRSGHALNNLLTRKLLEEKSSWELIDSKDLAFSGDGLADWLENSFKELNRAVQTSGSLL